MLNTDAHNPAIKQQNKMTKEQFVKNNRGLDAGHDLPREFLERIYDRYGAA
jgi:Sec7-like guanine-nucleotide exchange factor